LIQNCASARKMVSIRALHKQIQ